MAPCGLQLLTFYQEMHSYKFNEISVIAVINADSPKESCSKEHNAMIALKQSCILASCSDENGLFSSQMLCSFLANVYRIGICD